MGWLYWVREDRCTGSIGKRRYVKWLYQEKRINELVIEEERR